MSRRKILKSLANYVFSDDYILNIKFNDNFFHSFEIKDNLERLQYLARLCIIRNNCKCICENEILLIKKVEFLMDMYGIATIVKKGKVVELALFFQNYRTSISVLFRVLQKFSRNNLQKDIGFDVDKSENMISDFCLDLRDILQNYLLENFRELGGYNDAGQKKIVEIDESLF
ncbi:hypothetical protein DMUE_0614 [Dictyocoela muelleri]|nr:hypothetical protein DMUE_0614 [Dictyocoela muelleri]